VTICFVDESGTDSDLPIAVVAGLLLDYSGHFWLDVEWKKTLSRYGITGPIHMREFAPHGQFKDVTHDTRRALLADLTRVIGNNKLVSFAATLTADDYRRHFSGLTKLSMYGACFTNLLPLVGESLKIYGSTLWPLSFVVDDGNAFKNDIIQSKPILLKGYPPIVGIDFLSDHDVNGLQAADVLSWAVRRNLSGDTFGPGFEPLKDLFDESHLNVNYEEEWMRDIAAIIRAAESVDNSAPPPSDKPDSII
jgi:Protein of unknown function (DUF3800)